MVWKFGKIQLSLRVQTPPKKVFWGGFGGLNPFSGGTYWTLRVFEAESFQNHFALFISSPCLSFPKGLPFGTSLSCEAFPQPFDPRSFHPSQHARFARSMQSVMAWENPLVLKPLEIVGGNRWRWQCHPNRGSPLPVAVGSIFPFTIGFYRYPVFLTHSQMLWAFFFMVLMFECG